MMADAAPAQVFSDDALLARCGLEPPPRWQPVSRPTSN
jgi:hypothetical protein